MSYINYSNNAQNGFQNALATGMQMGAQVRQAREQKEERNALAAYAKNPDSAEAFGGLADVRPDIAIPIQQQRAQQAAQQQAQQLESGLVQQAMSGDPAALDQLATVNFDKWKTLSTEQRAQATQEAKTYGNAAMDVLQLPPEQRAQAVAAYGQQLGSAEIMQIAQLPPDQMEAALRAAVAEAGMVERLIGMEQPKYMAIPQGGTLVDVRQPEAVQQFAPQPYNPDEWEVVEEGTGSNVGGGFPGS